MHNSNKNKVTKVPYFWKDLRNGGKILYFNIE